ncbi:MAG: 2-hydroxyacyl-CoA dehydratase family protein [Verrucomicrobiota bacterium]
MEVFCTSPWVPPEWIKAHGLEPRGVWLAPDFAAEPLPLAAGVCAFANAAVRLAHRQTQSAVIFTTHCDQLRRGFDAVAQPALPMNPVGTRSTASHSLRAKSETRWNASLPGSEVQGASNGRGVLSRLFLFNLPVTWQTPVAQRIFCDELRRLGQFLIGLGGHAPATRDLVEIMAQYNHARRRLLAAALWCPARAYAEAVARFHLDGSVRLPPEPAAAAPGLITTTTPATPPPTLNLDTNPNLNPTPTPNPNLLNLNSIPLALVGGPLPQSQLPLLDAIEKAGGRVVLNATEAGERSLRPPDPWKPGGPADHPSPALKGPLSPSNGERAGLRGLTSVPSTPSHLDGSEPVSLWPASPPDQPQPAALLALLARSCLVNCVDVFQRPNTRLYDWLRVRLTARQARGIILWHYVGCDLWRAEAQPLRAAFGLPVLLLDADEAAPQRHTSRLEAFLESLR